MKNIRYLVLTRGFLGVYNGIIIQHIAKGSVIAMKNLSFVNHAIEYVFTYFSWGYFYFSAGYFCCDELNKHDIRMRRNFGKSYCLAAGGI